jgi:hypothetical protein
MEKKKLYPIAFITGNFINASGVSEAFQTLFSDVFTKDDMLPVGDPLRSSGGNPKKFTCCFRL